MSALTAGQAVWVAPMSQVHGRPIKEPVRGILRAHRPYVHPRGSVVTDGWDVSYPDATEQWSCHGGWAATTSIHVQHPGPRVVGRYEVLS